MSLGIYKKLFDLFESRCHAIDLKLYKLRVQYTDQDDMLQETSNFDEKVAAECVRQHKLDKEKAEKEQELEQLEEELPLRVLQHLNVSKSAFQGMANRAFVLRLQLQEMVIYFMK